MLVFLLLFCYLKALNACFLLLFCYLKALNASFLLLFCYLKALKASFQVQMLNYHDKVLLKTNLCVLTNMRTDNFIKKNYIFSWVPHKVFCSLPFSQNFNLKERIGEGTFSTVYLATRKNQDIKVRKKINKMYKSDGQH